MKNLDNNKFKKKINFKPFREGKREGNLMIGIWKTNSPNGFYNFI